MSPFARNLTALAVLMALGGTAQAVNVPHTFQAGDTARAAEVNANFAALLEAVNALEDQLGTALNRIEELEGDLAMTEAELAAVEADLSALESSVSDMDAVPASLLAFSEHLEVLPDPENVTGSTIRISQANLQIVNGEGATDTVNGLGNLIVGYNEPRPAQVDDGFITTFVDPVCSDGRHETEAVCAENGGLWDRNHKSGSHNIVGGMENAYSSYGGLVVGLNNVINRREAVVAGGWNNVASGRQSSVSGGFGNKASAFQSSVSGGRGNTASAQRSSILGGWSNETSGSIATVSGGRDNEAASTGATVSGGNENIASGIQSSVSGGTANHAKANRSSISGGSGNTTEGEASSISGGLGNFTGPDADRASILGGNDRIVSDQYGIYPN